MIPGKLLAGSYPGDMHEPGHSEKIRSLLEAGVRTFVCLQQRNQLEDRFRPYPLLAQTLFNELEIANPDFNPEKAKLEFLLCEIPDVHITFDVNARSCADTIIRRMRSGTGSVYVHCWGGHGRTGTIISIVLARLFKLSPIDAMSYFKASHKCRSNRRGHFPHSDHQTDQVKRLGSESFGSGEGATDDLPVLEDWTESWTEF